MMTQCPACRRELAISGAAFCPYCGASVQTPRQETAPEIRALLQQLEAQKDPVNKHQMLTQAMQQYPDSLEIAEEVLFLGRLYERNPRKLDFSVIKCYLWHMYLTPSAFSDAQKSAMRDELTAHPHLARCLQLAPDADAFLRHYLYRLAGEFVRLFLMSSNHYTKSWFGFRLDNRMGRVLAEPAADMICAIRADKALDEKWRALLSEAFYRAFVNETGGEARWVDAVLEKKGCSLPTGA